MSEINVTSRVPQGVYVAPLPFDFYNNDLVNTKFSNQILFADDLKLFCEVNDVGDCMGLQEDFKESVSMV